MDKQIKSNYWKKVVEQAKEQNEEETPFFSLAPMEAVTGSVFRRVIDSAAAPDVYYTEFTNATSVGHPKAKFSVAGRLHVEPNEQQPVAQLWGNKSIDFTNAAKQIAQQGYQAIDINMGCPDPTVVKNGAGSGLIKEFSQAADVIAATKEAGLPVSVKTRLGFYKTEEFREWIPFLLRQDVQVLTVHLRTRKEMSKVPAHYEFIDEILAFRDKIAPDTLIQINGDIKTREEGLELVKKHPGVDGVMIGRGVFENPFAFEKVPTVHTHQEMIDLLTEQIDLYDDFVENVAPLKFESLRRFFKIYVRGFSNAKELRELLMNTKTTDDVRKLLASGIFTAADSLEDKVTE